MGYKLPQYWRDMCGQRDLSDHLVLPRMLPSVVRCARRGFASHAKPHVHMPETAMLTNNVRSRGWLQRLNSYRR